ncbi:MAG: hypothetical protein VX589_11120, partial [Myxococcota bacterium]|nr:hypothetical protein [Myxococcota bacterium]
MFRIKHVLAVAMATFLFAGCNQVDSTHISTHEIRADISIVDDGRSAVEVTAQLQLADSVFAFLVLSTNEQFSVSTSAQHQTLHPGLMVYSARLDPSVAPQEVRFTLQRAFHSSAMDSWVTLPAPFEVFLDIESGPYGQDVIRLEWDELADDPTMIKFEGPCIHAYEAYIEAVNDDGVFT